MSSATLVGGEDETKAFATRKGHMQTNLAWSKPPTKVDTGNKMTTYNMMLPNDIDIPTRDEMLHFNPRDRRRDHSSSDTALMLFPQFAFFELN